MIKDILKAKLNELNFYCNYDHQGDKQTLVDFIDEHAEELSYWKVAVALFDHFVEHVETLDAGYECLDYDDIERNHAESINNINILVNSTLKDIYG